jgi:phospholipase C
MVIMDMRHWFHAPHPRRRVLQLGILTGISLTFGLGINAAKRVYAAGANPINHVLLACQENRTFDTYFGRYPQTRNFGFPADYAVPDGHGGTVKPHLVQSPITQDI